jgi:hypothetical protein
MDLWSAGVWRPGDFLALAGAPYFGRKGKAASEGQGAGGEWEGSTDLKFFYKNKIALERNWN